MSNHTVSDRTVSDHTVSDHEHDSHGSTPAAWTTVILLMIAFTAGTVGLVLDMIWMFWVSVGLAVASLIIGKVMSLMGLGAGGSRSASHAS